jgi:hypothetical protein
LGITGVCALGGIIHSPLPDAEINPPHHMLAKVAPAFQQAVAYQTPYHWAGAYALVVVLLLALSLFHREPAAKEGTTVSVENPAHDSAPAVFS